jgi:hypothetical protein
MAMQRLLLLAAALLTTGLAASNASAQSIQWTGHYYIAAGDAAGVPSVVVGFHDAWNNVQPIHALRNGELADFAVRPTPDAPSVGDSRYDVLAVGVVRDKPTVVAGYESDGNPDFGAGSPLHDVGRPHAVTATPDGYMIVASRSPDGPIETGDYVVAVGVPHDWSVVPGPDFRGGVFADMALAPSQRGVDALPRIVAVGTLDGRAYAVRGFLVDNSPVFYVEPELLPQIKRAVSVVWTGSYFVVMGVDDLGRLTLVYGHPGAWNESKYSVSDGMVPTDLAVAPRAVNYGRRAKDFDLLAIGTVKDLVATLLGEDGGQFPMLFADWAAIPGLGGGEGQAWPGPVSFAGVSTTGVSAASPNPTAGSARVTVTVSREQAVLVEVFDGIGRRVALLHNGVLAAGAEYAFALDARTLPEGTYHFRINGVDFTEVRTLTVAR